MSVYNSTVPINFSPVAYYKNTTSIQSPNIYVSGNYAFLTSFTNDALTIINVTFPSLSPCIYSGTGNWLIENTTCNITISTNLLKNNITINNATVNANGTISNYTIFNTKGNSIFTRKS